MKKILIFATALTMTALPMSEAFAFGRASEGTLRSVRKNTADTRDAVNDVRTEVRESADRIIAALRGHAGEGSAFADKQIEATKRITDAAQLNDTTRLRQEFRAAAESGVHDPDPAICLIAGLFGGGTGGSGGTMDTVVGSKVAGGAASKSSGMDPAVRAGGTALAKSIVDDRTTYAGRMGVSDPTTNPSYLVTNSTLPAEDATDEAAMERLIRNMTDPMPPRPVTAQEIRTEEGQSRAALRTIQETRAATAAEAIAMVINMRAPVGPTTDEWRAYVEDIANYNRPVGDQLSELQGIDIRTLRYYAPSEEALETRNNMSEKGLMQTLNDQLAIANRIAFIQLELDSRRAMVETQILSTLANN